MTAAIHKEKQHKQEERKAGQKEGKSKYQRTPKFIAACLKAALKALLEGTDEVVVQAPVCGYTDVGEHTGGIARDTSWPLVQHTIEVS